MGTRVAEIMRRVAAEKASAERPLYDLPNYIDEDAHPGQIYIINMPLSVMMGRMVDPRSRRRPALLWGIYRDEKGRIAAADFVRCSTHVKFPNDIMALHMAPEGKIAANHVLAQSIATIKVGSRPVGEEIAAKRSYAKFLPDLIARRHLSLLANNGLSNLIETSLDLTGMTRQGIAFPFFTRANIRVGTCQPDVPSPDQSFTQDKETLSKWMTPENILSIARWASWYTRQPDFRISNWPEPGRFPHWPGWEGEGHRRTLTFKDWSLDPGWAGHAAARQGTRAAPPPASSLPLPLPGLAPEGLSVGLS